MKQYHATTMILGLLLGSCSSTRAIYFYPVIGDNVPDSLKEVLSPGQKSDSIPTAPVTNIAMTPELYQGFFNNSLAIRTDALPPKQLAYISQEAQKLKVEGYAQNVKLGLLPLSNGGLQNPATPKHPNNLITAQTLKSDRLSNFKVANDGDWGFNPSSSKSLFKVTKGSQSIFMLRLDDKGYTYSLEPRLIYNSPKAKAAAYIIPSLLLTEEYQKNPYNILARAASLAEGHGYFNGNVYFHNPGIGIHTDPAPRKELGNMGAHSGQDSPAHEEARKIVGTSRLANGDFTLNDKLTVVRSGLHLISTFNYNNKLVEGLKNNGLWNQEMSALFFVNATDILTQQGIGVPVGQKVNRFAITYFTIKDYNRVQVVDFLKSIKVYNSNLDSGFQKLDLENLKIFAARMSMYTHNIVTRRDFCENMDCGMGLVAISNHKSWTTAVANDQYRRLKALSKLVSVEDFTKLLNAPVAIFPQS